MSAVHLREGATGANALGTKSECQRKFKHLLSNQYMYVYIDVLFIFI